MHEHEGMINSVVSSNIENDGSFESDVKISEEELVERMDRLRAMGKIIGEDFAMKVKIGQEPGWKYKFKPVNTIEVDPEDVKKKGLDYCLGILAHEGAHRRVSRVDFIPKKQWQETGFSFLLNAVEDPRVNNWVGNKYEGAKYWLELAYNEDQAMESKIDERAKAKLGYTPKHIQYGMEIIRYWHRGEFSENLPEDVRAVLGSTIKDAEMAYNTLPGMEPSEEEIVKKAEQMFKIVRGKIWPEYKKLVDKAIDDETVRQMIKDMIDKGELEIPKEKSKDNENETDKKEGKPNEPLSFDEIPEDVRKKIEEKLGEKMEDMTAEEREKILEIAEERARGLFDELESDLNTAIKGKFSDQPETKAEVEAREKAEKILEEEKKERDRKLAEARREFDKKLEIEKNDYEKAYEKAKPYIDKVSEDLMAIFINKRFPQYRRSFPGQKLRLKGAMNYEGQKDYRGLFERRQPDDRQDYTFLLLVDLSGSMRGQKIDETFVGTILFAEALAKVGETLGNIKVAVYGFQDELIPYKSFDSALDDETRKKMNTMVKEVKNEGSHNRANFNNDGYCVDTASALLKDRESKHKLLVVLSDGIPEGDGVHKVDRYADINQQEELRQVVRDVSAIGDQYVLGIGLGPATEHVKDFYSNSLPNVENIPSVDVKKLAEILADKLKELIK